MPTPETLQATYDKMPYPILTYRQTHPYRLAMIATVLGLEPPPPKQARVLDLGCASGGNIIPMAAHMPNAQFVGVDFAAVQIEEGQQLITDLGLSNITLHALSVTDITPDFGQFDYIIAHGLYSWVPDDVRPHVLRVCKENLSPNGIAYISYNTYPGWHMLKAPREMMLYHTNGMTDEAEAVRAATDLVRFVHANIDNDQNPAYKSFMDGYLELLGVHGKIGAGRELSSVYHDEMEVYNQPFYFTEFVEAVQEHALAYLSDADFASNFPNALSVEAQQRLAELSDSNLVQREQYMDFIRNRGFRMSLLVHQDAPIRRRLSLRPIVVNLRICGYAKPEPNPADPDGLPEVFTGGKDATFRTDHPVTRAAFVHLYEHRPQSFTFEALIEAALARLGQTEGDADDAEALALNILRAVTFSTQLIDLEAVEDDFVVQPGPYPTVSPLTRYMCAKGARVTNLRHERVDVGEVVRALMPYFDGNHSYNDLLEKLIDDVRTFRLMIMMNGEPVTDVEQVVEHLQQQLDAALEWMGRSALLMLSSPD